MGNLSRLINRVCGGKPGESLCARFARTRGSDCWPCLIVGFVLRDPMGRSSAAPGFYFSRSP
jgi:hypothetical protein